VLTRRFKRLMAEAPRAAVDAEAEPRTPTSPHGPSMTDVNALSEVDAPQGAAGEGGVPGFGEATPVVFGGDPLPQERERGTEFVAPLEAGDDTQEYAENEAPDSPWPDLVFIDGGLGQLSAARETLKELGVTDVPLIGIAKGPERDAGRETFFIPGREPIKLKPRDPVLYFVQRLRDEAHRFAIGSHRQKRKKDIREAGLQEIPGIGPTRKRALLRHFGTLKAIERASIADLEHVPGVNAETARKIYDFFHDSPARS
jgi:excinuclease ABC subunit C